MKKFIKLLMLAALLMPGLVQAMPVSSPDSSTQIKQEPKKTEEQEAQELADWVKKQVSDLGADFDGKLNEMAGRLAQRLQTEVIDKIDEVVDQVVEYMLQSATLMISNYLTGVITAAFTIIGIPAFLMSWVIQRAVSWCVSFAVSYAVETLGGSMIDEATQQIKEGLHWFTGEIKKTIEATPGVIKEIKEKGPLAYFGLGGGNELHSAIMAGKLRIIPTAQIPGRVQAEIRKLRTSGQLTQVNAKNNAGNTPLHLAVMRMYACPQTPDIVKLLIEVSGIDVNIQNKAGQTPLLIALNDYIESRMGQSEEEKFAKEMSALLLSKKADPFIADNNGTMPLHVMAFKGYGETVKTALALENKTKHLFINFKDGDGDTPLHKAVRCHDVGTMFMGRQITGKSLEEVEGVRLAIVKELLKHGARPELKNSAGNMPLDLANECTFKKIAALLEEHKKAFEQERKKQEARELERLKDELLHTFEEPQKPVDPVVKPTPLEEPIPVGPEQPVIPSETAGLQTTLTFLKDKLMRLVTELSGLKQGSM